MAVKIRAERNERGRHFEQRVAKLIRQKLGIQAQRDKRSGAGDVYKGDIAVPGLAWQMELKSQETIHLREWWRKLQADCSSYKSPLLVIDDTGYDEWAVLRLSDFLNLVRQIQDDTKMIADTREAKSHNSELGRFQPIPKPIKKPKKGIY